MIGRSNMRALVIDMCAGQHFCEYYITTLTVKIQVMTNCYHNNILTADKGNITAIRIIARKLLKSSIRSFNKRLH